MTTDQAAEQVLMRQVVNAVQRGTCTLFLGAGVHAGPPETGPYAGCYPEDQRPPIGKGLAESLAEKSELHERGYADSKSWELPRVALEHEQFLTRYVLDQDIRAAVDDGKQPSPVLKALAELDFPIVVTTNYDHLFEKALEAAHKKPDIRVYQKGQPVRDFPRMTPVSPTEPWLFKIHGDVDVASSMVVTDEDYIEFLLAMTGHKRPVPEPLGYSLVRYPTLFVGYSLLDYNLRLLFRTLRLGFDRAEPPTMYSVTFEPDPLITRVWAAYVTFLASDVWRFVPELYRTVKSTEMPA